MPYHSPPLLPVSRTSQLHPQFFGNQQKNMTDSVIMFIYELVSNVVSLNLYQFLSKLRAAPLLRAPLLLLAAALFPFRKASPPPLQNRGGVRILWAQNVYFPSLSNFAPQFIWTTNGK